MDLKTLDRYIVAAFAFFLLLLAPVPRAQTLPTTPAIPGMPPVPTTLEDRRKALAQVFHDYWEEVLKHCPELASALGDTRYDDQVANYTASAYNEALGREQVFLMQLAVIDQAGFTDDEKLRLDALDARFEEDQKAADQKPWETPISAGGSYYAVYPALAQVLPFTTAKDYDDWTARLGALPEAFAQAQQAMSLGMDDGHVPQKDVVDNALAEASALAHQKAEDSPLASPLKRFPAGVSATEQERIKQEMLDAINNDALPAYLRLERFLTVSYVPAAAKAGAAAEGTREAQLLEATLDLRTQAGKALGAKFDGKAFHDEMLDAGLLTVGAMKKRVNSWIGAGGK